AAQVAGQIMADFIRRWMRVTVEQFLRHKNETRRTKSALERAVRDKGFLDRMEFGARRESLDGDDFSSIDKSRQVETSAHGHTIHECRTTPTKSLPATLTRAKQTEFAPQNID